MDQDSEPPFAPETTSEQSATILAQIGIAVTNAAVRMNQLAGSQDRTAFAPIAGDLFEELVNSLEVQVKTTDHVALHGQVINWSRIQAKQLFDDPFSSQEVDVRAFGRHKRFLEDVVAHFSKPNAPVEARRSVASDESTTAKRPTLPIKVQAEIELARETFRGPDITKWPMIFGLSSTGDVAANPRRPKPANLKLQLREYASALFDLEAQHYPEHAKDEFELRAWLTILATSLSIEIYQELVPFKRALDPHCSIAERQTAIRDALGERSEHWVTVSKNQYRLNLLSGGIEPLLGRSPIRKEEPSPAPVRNRSLLPPESSTEQSQLKTISERLDDAALHEKISHEEQAHRIDIGRSTYFEVKAGRGGKKAKARTELYLSRLFSVTSMRQPD